MKNLIVETIVLGEELGEPEKGNSKREKTSKKTAEALVNALYRGSRPMSLYETENHWQVLSPDIQFMNQYLSNLVPEFNNDSAKDMDLWELGGDIDDPLVLSLARHLAYNYNKKHKK